MKRHIDYYFLGSAVFLLIFGVLFLATLSAPASMQIFGNTNYYIFHQLIRIGLGLILALIAFKTPLHIFKKFAFPLFIINLLLLAVVFLPVVGTKFWGAKRWISIGNNTFQPSEFLKITVVLYLSAWLSNRLSELSKKNWKSSIKRGYNGFTKLFVPFLVLLSVITIMLYLQRDISTLGVIAITLIVVYFVSGAPFWHILLAFVMGISSAALFIMVEPYRLQRLKVFLHPETDALGIGLQVKQSLIAIGSGGIFGKGLGMSIQKFGFLPQAMSDSIFAILGEETGIIGCIILIAIFLLFFWRSIRIANATNNTFARLTSVGIGTWITLQAFINIASTIGIFPLSGIPLPFLSYGGSHIIAEMIGMGILLNVSKNG